jgi:peptidoglycan/xylan/chitin deacetylase (PgdA/CDA1 family)
MTCPGPDSADAAFAPDEPLGSADGDMRAGPWEVSSDVPILMYHSIADDGPQELAPYRITPAAFREQLRYLRCNGFRSVGLADWAKCIAGRQKLPGRPVIITFDDGYQDFADHAWPLLEEAGFTATMFVVTDKVGGVADWDEINGDPPRLMDWDTLRDLQARGLAIGSHTASHPSLTDLPREAIQEEVIRSRLALRDELDIESVELAFPFGNWDDRVCEAVADAGYTACVTTYGGISTLLHNPLSLPRLEIFPDDDLQAFAAKVTPPRPRLIGLLNHSADAEQRPGTRRRRPPPLHTQGNAMLIHPDYAQKLAAQLDSLVGDFVALQSQLLTIGAAQNTLQAKLTQIFRQPVTGGVRQTIAPYHVLGPDVRVGFEQGAHVTLDVAPKRDFTASPDSCFNTLEFDFAGPSRWLSIEVLCEWPDLSAAQRYQIGIYASISNSTPGRAVLRLPRKDGTKTDEIMTAFELSRDQRCLNRSGELKLPDFVGVNMDQKPMLIIFLETREAVTIRLNYLNVYFD